MAGVRRFALTACLLALGGGGIGLASALAEDAPAKAPDALATIAHKTAGLQRMPGFFDCYWDDKEGKLWLDVGRFDVDFLYVEGLAAGVGSNDIGLDRGQLGANRVVRFVRVGPKVLLMQRNLDFRAVSANPDERAAVDEAFAQAVLWGFKVEAEENGHVLVDASSFVLQDAHNVAGTLAKTKQGTYKVDDVRSAIYLPRTKSFPRNTEFEGTLTFTGKSEGESIKAVAPEPDAVTVREHQSFVELPDDQFQPRVFDPRCGYYAMSFADYASPIDQPLVKRFIPRHRLRKKDPAAAVSEPVDPIVYYVDRGAPEPIRTVLMEGASWWDQAFEAAGYKGAFVVKEMPAGADPMDVRYNVIQWVHRATRGWSYGASVIDPRTGEIIQGRVTLGSLRARQDFLIAQGLLQPYASGTPPDPRMLQMAIARLHQLAAHEVGHTLGLQHNFAGSADGRSSVMDYPPPYVTLGADGTPDLAQAYAVGIGQWDKRAILYGYQDFAPGIDEKSGLAAILQGNLDQGLHYITDADARAPGGAHPLAHLWDSGASAVDELNRLVKVRAAALGRFGENNIPRGAPMAALENVLVPVYLMHRYQAEAAIKLVGGVNYAYAVRGDGQPTNEALPEETQRAALAAVVQTLQPAFLALPDKIVALIPPRPPGYDRDRELFDPHTGLIFDPLAAAEGWVNAALDLLFNPQRLSRIIEQNARGPRGLTVQDIFNGVLQAADVSKAQNSYEAELARMVETRCVQHLFQVVTDPDAQGQVNAEALQKLTELEAAWRGELKTPGTPEGNHARYLFWQVETFRRDPKAYPSATPAKMPDGSPIGCGGEDFARATGAGPPG